MGREVDQICDNTDIYMQFHLLPLAQLEQFQNFYKHCKS